MTNDTAQEDTMSNTTKDILDMHIVQPAITAESALRKTREDFADKVRANGVKYAIEWGNDHLISELNSELWMRVGRRIENDVQPFDALTAEVERCEQELLEDYHRSSSTSMLSNAGSEATRSAYSRFARNGRGILNHIERQS